jgi:hypothetical protein
MRRHRHLRLWRRTNDDIRATWQLGLCGDIGGTVHSCRVSAGKRGGIRDRWASQPADGVDLVPSVGFRRR